MAELILGLLAFFVIISVVGMILAACSAFWYFIVYQGFLTIWTGKPKGVWK